MKVRQKGLCDEGERGKMVCVMGEVKKNGLCNGREGEPTV